MLALLQLRWRAEDVTQRVKLSSECINVQTSIINLIQEPNYFCKNVYNEMLSFIFCTCRHCFFSLKQTTGQEICMLPSAAFKWFGLRGMQDRGMRRKKRKALSWLAHIQSTGLYICKVQLSLTKGCPRRCAQLCKTSYQRSATKWRSYLFLSAELINNTDRSDSLPVQQQQQYNLC